MSIRIDVSDLTRNLPAERDITDGLIKELANKMALDLHAGLVQATPVDTGRARAGWTVDTGDMPVVENNVEYIGVLNNGHSKQALAGFVENEIDKATRL